MNREDVLSGSAGLNGLRWAVMGASERRFLRGELRQMLNDGCQLGPLHITRLKFKPKKRLSAYYLFSVFDPSSDQSRTIPLSVNWGETPAQTENDDEALLHIQEEAGQRNLLRPFHQLWRFRSVSDWCVHLQIWPLDADFPKLPRLGDPAYSRQLFLSANLHPPGEKVTVKPIRYRPGERHVLLYLDHQPEDPPIEQPRRFYAKLYRTPEAAARAFGVANRIVDWLGGQVEGFQGIQPAGWSPEDAVVFYPHAPGVALSKQLHRSPIWLAHQLSLTGKALSVLHNSPDELMAELQENPFEGELRVVRRASEHVRVLLPELANRILRLLDAAQEMHEHLPKEPATFTHSDFKADHLLASPQGLTLIDFDTCARADPALDIGKFLADLEWWFTLTRTGGVEQAQDAFLKGYAQGNESGRLSRARLYQALILLKITTRRAPLYSTHWASLTTRLIGRAENILQQAAAPVEKMNP